MGIEEFAPEGWDRVASLWELATWLPSPHSDHARGFLVDDNDELWSVSFTDGGTPPRPHREDGPAVVSHEKEEDLLVLRWFQHGFPHRDGGPALIAWDRSGRIRDLEWHQWGKLLDWDYAGEEHRCTLGAHTPMPVSRPGELPVND